MSSTSILIVDDHALFRRGLISIIDGMDDFFVAGEACDGFEGFAMAEKLNPEIVLLDVNMPVCNGIQTLKKIKAAFPKTKVLMLTAIEDNAAVIEALRCGADGFLLKDINPENFHALLERVRGGQSILSDSITKTLIEKAIKMSDEENQQIPSQEKPDAARKEALSLMNSLTKQEYRVLMLVSEGKSNKEIAAELFISENTAKIHIRNILDKLGLPNRIQAAVFVIQNGLNRNQRL